MLRQLKACSLRLLNGILVGAVALLVLDVLLGVASRYLWGAQVKWTEELATILLIWVSFLGAAAAFEARAHLGIDFLTERFPPSARRKTELAAHLCTIGFVVIAFLFGGSILVRQALVHRNILPALQISDVVMYLPLPVSGVFILIYEVANLTADWRRNKSGEEEEK